MPSLSSLSEIPFLDRYRARERQIQDQGTNELRQAGALAQLQAQMQAQQEARAARQEAAQRDAAFSADLQALGNNPTQEQLAGVGARHVRDPKALMDIQQKSLDRRAASEDRINIANENRAQMALQFSQNLDQRQQALEQRRTEFEARTSDAASRQQFEQWYKTESLKNSKAQSDINSQMRLLGFEIQKQGQQMQLMRLDQAKADREERQIEGQIGKTADRMKDLTPVFTSAKQLNDILSRYTPDTVPGLGYAKNTDIGKAFLTDQGQDVSSSIKLFGNSVLKAMSGAAVTAPEEIRQMAALMADGRFGAKDFYIAWPKITQWVNDQVSLTTSGLTPPAKERFMDRTGLKLDKINPRFSFDGMALKDSQAVPPPPPGFKVD